MLNIFAAYKKDEAFRPPLLFEVFSDCAVNQNSHWVILSQQNVLLEYSVKKVSVFFRCGCNRMHRKKTSAAAFYDPAGGP